MEKEKISYVKAVLLMGIFTFLFLSIEYLYVNVVSGILSEETTVKAQNYALGASAIGFVIYPVCRRICKGMYQTAGWIVNGIIIAAGLIGVKQGNSAGMVLTLGLVLFLFLGIMGSAVFYFALCLLKNDRYLARIAGVGYMTGILLQVLKNTLIQSEVAEIILFILFLTGLEILLIRTGKQMDEGENENTAGNGLEAKAAKREGTGKNKTSTAAVLLLIVLIVLLTCIFSTLDNAVTLVHATGAVDIGQAPRFILAFSGLLAGFLFDMGNRKFMNMVMYCVTLLSTLCVAALKFSEPFLMGLIIFYMSAGFFAVFFTTAFMEISRYTHLPELWAGMGRAVNNLTAAVITGGSLNLLSSELNIQMLVITILLFVLASVVTTAYTYEKKRLMEIPEPDKKPAGELDEKKRIRQIAERFSFTERETETFFCLVSTEDSVQQIADDLCVSKRTLERYISSIYEKTGVKSRVALIGIYNDK